jgi:hypothetical protein
MPREPSPAPSSSSSALGDVGARERDEFFDPNADDADARALSRASGGSSATDAILSCPGCFTEVCVLCQKHARYAGQYRAVFAQNVCVVRESALVARGGGDGAGMGGEEAMLSDVGERFHEVKCATCREVVGVIDDDEVYHFFNVFPSQG